MTIRSRLGRVRRRVTAGAAPRHVVVPSEPDPTPAGPADPAPAHPHVQMGRHSYALPGVISFPGDTGSITIGSYCSINGQVKVFLGGEHIVEWVTTYPLRIKLDLPGAFDDGCPRSKGTVEIGHDVWVGYDALIMSGVRIGHGAVVAARSVVTRDVAPYEIVGGNPARHIRWRFDAEERDALLRLQWWHWPEEKVRAEVDALNGMSVREFLARHGPGVDPSLEASE